MMPAAPPDGSLEQPKDRELFNMQNHMHNKQVVYFMYVASTAQLRPKRHHALLLLPRVVLFI
jgi:hypothetical protein